MITSTTALVTIAALLYAIALKLEAVPKPGRFEYFCFVIIGIYMLMGWTL